MSTIQELHRVKVPTENLQIGMYVAELDIPWNSSPFTLQGFVIKSDNIRAKLRQICTYVLVDSTKSTPDNRKKLSVQVESFTRSKSKKNGPYQPSSEPLPIDNQRYARRPPMTLEETRKARSSYQKMRASLGGVYQSIQNNSATDSKQIEKASGLLVSSALSYPSSLSWLAMIQEKSSKTYDHSLRTATWALLCGRHIGLNQADLKWLAIGCMLKDFDQLVKEAKRKKASGSEDAVDYVSSLSRAARLNRKAIEVINYHKECFNGTGKPKGLLGEQIPLLARIASIAEAYDLLLNPMDRLQKPMSPSQAERAVYSQRGRAFQDELVIQFIEALGTYPLGTVLKLNSGETAMVVDQDPKFRLKPTLLVFADQDGQPLASKRILRLSEYEKNEALKGGGDHKPARILSDVSKNDLHFNMSTLLEEYCRLREVEERSKRSIFSRLFSRQSKMPSQAA